MDKSKEKNRGLLLGVEVASILMEGVYCDDNLPFDVAIVGFWGISNFLAVIKSSKA